MHETEGTGRLLLAKPKSINNLTTEKEMKDVVLRMDDSAFETVLNFIKLCPCVEVVSEYSYEEVRKDVDICIEKAIFELKENGVFRKPSDYTYIMQVINSKKVKDAPFFLTPDMFRLYLKEIGVQPLPGRSTIYDTIQIMDSEYPHWTFIDPKIDEVETLRRNNVARQFLSTVGRLQRGFSDRISDKG